MGDPCPEPAGVSVPGPGPGVVRALDGTRVSLEPLRDKNVAQLRRLNASIFPVKYQDKYYADAMGTPRHSRLALYGDVCVGAVACRMEVRGGGGQALYIMTLGVLAPYRRRGIGSILLDHVLARCESESPAVTEIYLHVQTNNDEAIAFYKRNGFEITGTLENYYKRLDPPDCYILSKTFKGKQVAPKRSSSVTLSSS